MRVAQEINYLSALTGIPCREFKHTLIAGQVVQVTPSSTAITYNLFTYQVPSSYGLIVTKIMPFTTTIYADPLVNGVDVIIVEDFSYPPLVGAELLINGYEITEPSNTQLFADKDMLLALNGGDTLQIDLTAGGNLGFDVAVVVNGYFIPSRLVEKVVNNQTAFIQL